jgi:hypothetical protein
MMSGIGTLMVTTGNKVLSAGDYIPTVIAQRVCADKLFQDCTEQGSNCFVTKNNDGTVISIGSLGRLRQRGSLS